MRLNRQKLVRFKQYVNIQFVYMSQHSKSAKYILLSRTEKKNIYKPWPPAGQ